MHSVGFAGKVRTENSRSNDVARLLLASTLVGVAVAYSRDRTDFYLSFPFFEDIIPPPPACTTTFPGHTRSQAVQRLSESAVVIFSNGWDS